MNTKKGTSMEILKKKKKKKKKKETKTLQEES